MVGGTDKVKGPPFTAQPVAPGGAPGVSPQRPQWKGMGGARRSIRHTPGSSALVAGGVQRRPSKMGDADTTHPVAVAGSCGAAEEGLVSVKLPSQCSPGETASGTRPSTAVEGVMASVR